MMKYIFIDVDGVLTDNKYIYDHSFGDWGRMFSVSDGYGLKLLSHMGFNVCIISGDYHEATKARLERFPFVKYFGNVTNKLSCIQTITKENTNSFNVYIGNEPNDLTPGLFCDEFYCPKDAHWLLKKVVLKTLSRKGGEGVITELAELLYLREYTEDDLMRTYMSWYE